MEWLKIINKRWVRGVCSLLYYLKIILYTINHLSFGVLTIRLNFNIMVCQFNGQFTLNKRRLCYKML